MKIRVEDNGDGTFSLVDPLEYRDGASGRLVRVPAGFTTDYASVPPALQSLAPKIGRQNRAAIIHDWLYHTRGVPRVGASEAERFNRADCDRIFREVMAADGVPARLRWRMWLGVRLGGWACFGA